MMEINDSNDYVNWIEKAVTENYIKNYDYSEFTNIKEINSGSVGSISRASWKGTDTLLIIKSSYKLTVKEIVNEVFDYKVIIIMILRIILLL
jgi:hypothetical protein